MHHLRPYQLVQLVQLQLQQQGRYNRRLKTIGFKVGDVDPSTQRITQYLKMMNTTPNGEQRWFNRSSWMDGNVLLILVSSIIRCDLAPIQNSLHFKQHLYLMHQIKSYLIHMDCVQFKSSRTTQEHYRKNMKLIKQPLVLLNAQLSFSAESLLT